MGSSCAVLPLTSSSQPTALPCHIHPRPTCSYGPQWEAHVLSNLPFFFTLLPLFLEASVPRVEVRAQAVIRVCMAVVGWLVSLQDTSEAQPRCAASGHLLHMHV